MEINYGRRISELYRCQRLESNQGIRLKNVYKFKSLLVEGKGRRTFREIPFIKKKEEILKIANG